MAMNFNGSSVEVEITNLNSNSVGDRTTGSATNRSDTYTVPVGKYWVVRSCCIRRANTGGCDFVATIGGTNYYFSSVASAVIHYEPNLNIRLEAGDSVVLIALAGTSGTIESDIIYEEFTA